MGLWLQAISIESQLYQLIIARCSSVNTIGLSIIQDVNLIH